MSAAQTVVAVVLWISAGLVLYHYVGYPLLIWCLSRTFGRHRPRPVSESGNLPRVTLLIAAHNEEADIEKRLRSALAMDYPPEHLEIVVASDGSTDATGAIVRRFADRGVRLLDYPVRRGKAAVLNAAFAEVRGDIVLLSDANTFIDREAVGRLVRWFDDPSVGVVCGRLILTDPRTGRNVDSLYWKYETFLKRCEGRLGALLGANGAIYALRRRLYQALPGQTLVDDFVIPLLARLRTGCSIVYDYYAVAREETPAHLGCEFHRRSRIGAGGFQSIGLLYPLLHPRQGWAALAFLSHKILRWSCPFLLLVLLGGNLLLLDQPFYRGTMLAQIGFYALSLLAGLVPVRMRFLKPLRLSTMFTTMNLALLVGFCRWLWSNPSGVWRRTERLEVTAEVLS